MQCDDCCHDAVVGGTVLPAQRQCTRLQQTSDLHVAVAALCRIAAQQAQCPLFEPLLHGPGSYRAQDLPRDQLLDPIPNLNLEGEGP